MFDYKATTWCSPATFFVCPQTVDINVKYGEDISFLLEGRSKYYWYREVTVITINTFKLLVQIGKITNILAVFWYCKHFNNVRISEVANQIKDCRSYWLQSQSVTNQIKNDETTVHVFSFKAKHNTWCKWLNIKYFTTIDTNVEWPRAPTVANDKLHL